LTHRPNNRRPAVDGSASAPASLKPWNRELPESNLADDPMTRLWQDADDRETGAEAVEAMRARRKNLGPRTAKPSRFRG
jgi:hypothetical protein